MNFEWLKCFCTLYLNQYSFVHYFFIQLAKKTFNELIKLMSLTDMGFSLVISCLLYLLITGINMLHIY